MPDPTAVYLEAGSTYRASVIALDSDSDPLTFAWDIRPEVVIPSGSYAGSKEKKAEPIDGLVRNPGGRRSSSSDR